MRKKRVGITLVEVLVTIGIIGILAGILIPLLPYVRECGNVNTCVSNQRQLAAALLEYASDWNGIVPGGAMLLDKTGKHIVSWDQAIKPYVSDDRIYHCPSDTSGGTRSYALNDQRYRVGKNNYGDIQGTRLSVIKDTARTGLLKDWHNKDNNLGSGMWVSHIIPPALGECWHHKGGGSVVAFFDGHARYVKGDTLKDNSFFFNPDP